MNQMRSVAKGGYAERVCGNSFDREARCRFRRLCSVWREIVIWAALMDCGDGGR